MPTTNTAMKRPPISGFGEGTVSKRSHIDVPGKLHVRSATTAAKAILSGPDDGFRAKSNLPVGGQRLPRRLGLPSNQVQAAASFKAPACTKPLFGVRPPPLPLSDMDSPFVEPQKKLGAGSEVLESPLRKVGKQERMTTPFSNRICLPELRTKRTKEITPARKIVPFHALPIPVPIPDETQGNSSSSPLKGPHLPKFELGRKEKGKLSAMTALEPPAVESTEEKEVDGEALELQRGLLVSPEKAERRRGKFVRNGLAERAQMIMNRTSTALVLWKKEMESLGPHPNRLNPDLRLHVTDIVHVSRNAHVHSRSAGALRSALTICALPGGEERRVLFSFTPDAHGCHASDSTAPPKVGNEVLVWRPWQETKHPPTLFCSRFLLLSGPPRS